MCMSEGQPRSAPDADERPSDARDEALARIRQVLDRALGPASTVPAPDALAQIAAILAWSGHGLSEAELEQYLQLWWDED